MPEVLGSCFALISGSRGLRSGTSWLIALTSLASAAYYHLAMIQIPDWAAWGGGAYVFPELSLMAVFLEPCEFGILAILVPVQKYT